MCLVGLCGAYSGSAQSLTILEYSQAQRAVLEAEMAKNTAKALTPASSLPVSNFAPPSHAELPSVRSSVIPSPAALGVNGVVVLSSRSVAEVQVAGVSHYLSEGERVPGTSWRVSLISARQVTLVQSRPGHRPDLARRFELPANPRNVSSALGWVEKYP